ncbi:YihY/virulence factor BrkB family protein [Frigoribacterium sp. CFBP 13707]|uniref:YihY/virulence factor BrkB family protein n=1 Tax=Frigoribacterium sp. CFBP 13707 TaxID=2775313 RepID=UPI00177E53E5|nr:YihY/virulence factor BrkB family protein [Frigoribacterium sp. CFBP 13707]MBD8728628.1 YihY/virulence factor BrkB family protein [Frigoribacterium sp. CFBP 13707]
MPSTRSLPENPSLTRYVVMRVWHDFLRHRTIDAAAALTFFSTLSILPTALALVSGVALFQEGEEAVDEILGVARYVLTPSAVDTLRGPLEQMLSLSNPGVAFGIGLWLTLWSLSSYTTAFGRAMNTAYDVEEGRRIWKFRGHMMIVTLVLMVSFAVIATILLVTPTLARGIGDAVGFGEPFLTLWNVLKWPVLVALAVFAVAMLYYFTPNVRPPHLRWVSYGAMFALGIWAVCTVGFALYVTTFSNYDRFYGWLGMVIVVLLYSYISNFVLVIGGELDSEVLRLRQLRRGLQAEEVIPLPMRDTARNHILARNSAWDVRVGRAIRERALRENGGVLDADELRHLQLRGGRLIGEGTIRRAFGHEDEPEVETD